jgi:Protein of unknown function (DUF2971)
MVMMAKTKDQSEMIRPEVTVLYKYCPVTDYSLDSLRTGAFWFAAPRTFNDPFDCAITLAEDALQESIEHAIRRITADPRYASISIPPERWRADARDAQAYARFRDSLFHVLDDAGILCLAEACDDILMWGHYSNSHRGVCIGFQRNPSTLLGRGARPVNYRSEYPRLSFADFDPAANPHSVDQLWLTKAAAWNYEREWRVLMPRGDQLYNLDAPVRTVVFGACTSEADRRAVVEAVNVGGHTPDFMQATPSRSRFELEMKTWEG